MAVEQGNILPVEIRKFDSSNPREVAEAIAVWLREHRDVVIDHVLIQEMVRASERYWEGLIYWRLPVEYDLVPYE